MTLQKQHVDGASTLNVRSVNIQLRLIITDGYYYYIDYHIFIVVTLPVVGRFNFGTL